MIRIVLLRLLESYFRHRWLYLLPLVIAIASGAAFVLNTAPEYVATGRLYVVKESLLASLTSTTNNGNWWLTAAQATTSELDELIASRAFTRLVIQKTDLEQNMSGGHEMVDQTFTYYRTAINVQPRGDKLVEISASSDDPKLARQLALATMDAYVQWQISSGREESKTAETFFEGLIQPYQEDVDKARAELVAYLNAHPQPIRGDRPPEEQLEVERLQAAVQRAEDRLISAQNNQESAQLARAKSESVTRQTYMMIDAPEEPTEPEVSLKKVAMNLAIFVAIGMFLSAAGIGAGALLDRSLRFPIDVRHGLSLPVLGMVPPASPSQTPPPAVAAVAVETPPSDGTTQPEGSVLQPQL